MDNFFLFIMGIAITAISGMGILVYYVSLGYKPPKIEKIEPLDSAASSHV